MEYTINDTKYITEEYDTDQWHFIEVRDGELIHSDDSYATELEALQAAQDHEAGRQTREEAERREVEEYDEECRLYGSYEDQAGAVYRAGVRLRGGGMSKMSETVLHGSKKYRGNVRWVKLAFPNGIYKIERRRPFGWDSTRITKTEYNFIDSAEKANAIHSYHHFMGTASWWGGEIRHPIAEFNTIADDVLANRDQYEHGLHYNNSMVDVVIWMFHNAEQVAP